MAATMAVTAVVAVVAVVARGATDAGYFRVRSIPVLNWLRFVAARFVVAVPPVPLAVNPRKTREAASPEVARLPG
ncbi:hypothetical protein F5Y06DRAFT_256467 [Hypoxylon sp. FL0890]|nr:hypothetical protein F5Y06DRAFT_256467 [Hypoxylon sp. FL0890]